MKRSVVLPRWAAQITLGLPLCIVLFVVLGFCVAGIVVSLREKGFSADAASWAQAGGSIAAIAGAAWLASLESNRQRRQRRIEREEVAWGVHFALRLAVLEAAAIAREVIDADQCARSEFGRHWLTRSRNAKALLSSYANRSDHIHPAIAQEAFNGVLLADQMIEDIQLAGEQLKEGSQPSLSVAEDLAWYEIHFQWLADRVADRMRLIGAELDRSSDVLPTRDWFTKPRR